MPNALHADGVRTESPLDAAVPPAPPADAPGRPRSVLADGAVQACALAWLVPVAVAVVRALATGWYPVADEALIAVGGGDELTGHHRLIGTAASVSFEGELSNHPGPLIFDVVAVPVRLLGAGAGLVVGIAVLNLAAGLVAIVAAARTGGRAAAVVTTLGLLLLTWSAGNGVLVDPYNPTASMIPFFAVLVLAWAAVDGDRWALAWLAAWSTFCVQTNVAYAATTVPIVAGALAVFLWRRRGQRAWRDVLIRCAPVAALLWSQPLVEQLAHGRDGNLTRMARNVDNLVDPLGFGDGTRRAALVLARWPGWGRGNFDGGATGPFEELPSLVVSVVGLVVLLGLLAGLAALAARRLGDRSLAALAACAAGSVAVGWVGTARVPLSPFYGFLAHFVRWLWPIGAFAAVAVGLFTVRAAQHWCDRMRAPGAAALGVGALVAGVVIALPEGPPALDSDLADAARPAAVELNSLAVERLPSSGVVVDFRPPAYSMFAFSLVAALQEHGTPFRVMDEISVRQFGDERRAAPDDEAPVVFLAVGFEALDVERGAVACVSELDGAEKRRLTDARAQLAEALWSGQLALSEIGARFAGSPFAPGWMSAVAEGFDAGAAAAIVDAPAFRQLLGQDLIVVPEALDAAAADFVDLGEGLEQTTACVVRGDS